MEAIALGTAAGGGATATAGLFGVGGAFSAVQTMMTIGTALITGGALSQASAQQQQYDYASQAATYNAQVAQNNAIAARQQGEAEADRQRRQAMKTQGKMTAAFSASGVTLEGSPLDLLAESATLAELDAQTIKYNTELKAQGYEQSAALERASSYNAYQRGTSAATSGLLTAGGALMSGGAKIFAGSPTRVA